VVARICEAAADRAGDGGLLVDYRELPGAIGRIMAHFGISAGATERAAMMGTAGRDAKSPWQEHVPDSEAKQSDASPAVRDAVARHLAGPHRRLETLRRAQDK
jgi:hypothetical protein